MKFSLKHTNRCAAALLVMVMLAVFAAPSAYAVGDNNTIRGETVYIDTDADGNVKNVISSVYISNPDNLDSITDRTTLSEIKNILSSEPPAIDGNDAVFKTDGNDVCYQGRYAGELPFDLNITYKLDGKEMSADELAGKSGRIEISVNFENKLLNSVEVNGEALELYTPMTMICMTSLPDGFEAVEAENARISTQAGSITVMAALLPGMAKNLEMEQNDKVKDGFTITANVTDFEFAGFTIIGLSGLVRQSDLTGIDNIQELLDALDELDEASEQLYNGSKQLNDGLSDYESGIVEYAKGISELSEAVITIWSGTREYSSGVEKFSEGADEIRKGIIDMSSQMTTIEQMMQKLTSEGISADNEELNKAIKEALEDVLDQYGEEIRLIIVEELTELLSEYMDPAVAAVAAEQIADEIMERLNNFEVDDEMVQIVISALQKQIVNSIQYKKAVSGIKSLKVGVSQLVSGLEQLADAADSLKSGADSLTEGMGQLAEGSEKLKINSQTLTDAVKLLNDGADLLTSGLKTLSDDGLDRITEETDNINLAFSRKDVLIQLSNSFRTVSGLQSSEDDSVQFLITTAEIKTEKPIYAETTPTIEPDIEVMETEEKEDFFASVGKWFEKAFADIGEWFSNLFGGGE